MHREGRVPDFLPFYNAVLNREHLADTAMESGMAFPHARLHGLKELSFALGRGDKPLTWGKTSRPVQLVFLLAVPAADATQYLLLISGLVRLAKQQDLLPQLLAAQDSSQILKILQQVPLPERRSSKPPLQKALPR
jgi:mannitol/fructose-specific phosphotransferase system IIA component (Ntr-type)